MDKGITKIINSYFQYLHKEKIRFEKAYLFGSLAKSRQTKYSDIDIALIFNKKNIKDRFVFRSFVTQHKSIMKINFRYDEERAINYEKSE